LSAGKSSGRDEAGSVLPPKVLLQKKAHRPTKGSSKKRERRGRGNGPEEIKGKKGIERDVPRRVEYALQ